ncbi:hypothetical protein ILUMI_09058 [Ignelater luminosus]|uniref:ABC transporter domain-containing protein n=1 Tax=Ignelater luminosus TaxID=2038154 RepID=A0A8K0GCT6_IGNLU|nr:hypothetical protein ILUMI_09058 [Ignelater luminosus]
MTKNSAEGTEMTDCFLQKRKRILTEKENAVCVRNAYKQYGSKNNLVVVLDGLNMTVPKGVIYGLLGANGCGKTTLLHCIIGYKTLNSGDIWALGGPPLSKQSGVPGSRVGFMPQDAALYDKFSILETLMFFGWISEMKTKKIKKRSDFLIELLMLPDKNSIVGELGLGQRRRVSLAATLIQEPELLLLDEPTVGLDPVLRENIWNHFLDLTNTRNTTIIITTHYIDEASQSHMVALMREGYLLVEESPNALLNQFNAQTLENVFLQLSITQSSRTSGNYRVSQNEFYVSNDNKMTNYKKRKQFLKKDHVQSLLWKNFSWMMRNKPIMLFCLLLPFIQMAAFCLSIGNDVKNIKVAVVNYETNNTWQCKDEMKCNDTQLSCQYLKYLEKMDLTLVNISLN